MRPSLERAGVYDAWWVRQRRDFTPAHGWVIETGGEFAGCVMLRPAEGCRHLEYFSIAAGLQGRGIGTGVLRHLLERCDQDGVPVRLQVLQDSPARALYERHGFTVEAEDAIDVFMIRQPGA